MKIKCFNSTNYFKTLYNVDFFFNKFDCRRFCLVYYPFYRVNICGAQFIHTNFIFYSNFYSKINYIYFLICQYMFMFVHI